MLLHRTKFFRYGPVKSIALYILPDLSIFVLEDEHSESSPPPFTKVLVCPQTFLRKLYLGSWVGANG